ncbi:Uncharacterised protein [Cedecea neteri]|uniref:Uncharacterized protein n=1 Tax=Cedecea neteri TaxID=158822 RepID=A0A2X3J3A3_9ENTR|nr:Uncharacterised protein [Cedecea neteri]
MFDNVAQLGDRRTQFVGQHLRDKPLTLAQQASLPRHPCQPRGGKQRQQAKKPTPDIAVPFTNIDAQRPCAQIAAPSCIHEFDAGLPGQRLPGLRLITPPVLLAESPELAVLQQPVLPRQQRLKIVIRQRPYTRQIVRSLPHM